MYLLTRTDKDEAVDALEVALNALISAANRYGADDGMDYGYARDVTRKALHVLVPPPPNTTNEPW